MKRITVTLFLCVMMISVITGYGECATDEGLPGKILRVGINAQPTSLNPYKANNTGQAYMTDLVFNTLTKYDASQGHVVPVLAKSWEVVDDTTIRFKLRDDVYFSNGEKMTAKDVKFSFELSSVANFAVGMLDSIDGPNSVVEDDYTFLMKLKKPYAPILNSCAHMLSSIVCSTNYDEEKPIGTGPFVIKEWALGDYVEYGLNEHYFGEPVSFSTLLHRYIPEAATRAIELEAGGLDIAVMLNDNDAIRLMNSGQKDVIVEQMELLNTTYLSFNCAKEPYNNPKVRQAITHAIDIDTLVKASSQGLAKRVYSTMSPMVMGYYDPGVVYPYDVEKAKQLLNEAGYPNGFKAGLYTDAPSVISEMIQAYLAEIGIELEIMVLDRAVYIDALVTGKHDMYLGIWTVSSGDADYGLNTTLNSRNHGSGGNRSFFTNEKLDEFLNAAAVEMNVEKRMNLYKDAQILIAQEAPYVNLYAGYAFVGYRNNIKNLIARPTARYDYWLVDIE